MVKEINIVLFGIGNTGSAFIRKVARAKNELIPQCRLDIRFPVIANSVVAFYEKEGGTFAWEAGFIRAGASLNLHEVYEYIYNNSLENIIVVDATASSALAGEYSTLMRSGFHIVSVNAVLQELYPGFDAQVRLLGSRYNMACHFPVVTENTAEAAADAIYDAVLNIARRYGKVA